MAALKIAFLGYNAQQTHRYFEQLAVDNVDQVKRFSRVQGHLLLKDGTEIIRVSHIEPGSLQGRLFDQIIIADTKHLKILETRYADLCSIIDRCWSSAVPADYRIQLYDIDAEAPMEG